MKLRFLILAILVIFLINSISAEIVIQQNPSNLYNLGDTMSIPIKITSLSEFGDRFLIKLICNEAETELHREYVLLQAGGEVERNPPIPLIKSFIGDLKGICRLKYVFGTEIKLTNEFTISELININITTKQNEFVPQTEITLEGQAKRENGESVNGFVDMELIRENASGSIFASNTVKNSLFTLKFSLPKETASGQYLLKIKVYEKDSKGEITNTGFYNYNILATQVPTNLEVFIENQELEPSETLRTKAILHDQTGQQISSTSNILIKNGKGKIIEQREISTDEFFELQIPSNNLPDTWTIIASSSELTGQSLLKIKSVEKIETQIVNKTLIIENIGNVLYNHTLLIKIGAESVNVDVLLKVGESKKYGLSAPEGEYNIEVVIDGKSNGNENVFLTGKAIDVQENGFSLENNTIIWIIIIIVLAFFGIKLFRRWHKKSFFGYPVSEKNRPEKKEETIQLKKSSVITKNKAELSLSVKGDQQEVSLVCLKIKNIDKLKESKTNYEEILQKIVNMAEEQKAYIYGAQENIFLIYAPTKTKTFKNERTAINTTRRIESLVREYNKMAREKIILGISVNHGTIVAGAEGNVLKFMSMGTLMNSAKKLASLSDGELLLSEKIRDKLGADIKTQKKEISGTTAYIIKEIRDDEKSKEFIRKFMDRMDKGK